MQRQLFAICMLISLQSVNIVALWKTLLCLSDNPDQPDSNTTSANGVSFVRGYMFLPMAEGGSIQESCSSLHGENVTGVQRQIF